MASAGQVAVWEWLNEFGLWAPYSCPVSNHIEKHRAHSGSGGGGGGGLNLGTADPNLAHYTLDLQQMIQIRQGTGTARNIRRSVYPASSTAATGISWQWEGDHQQWTSYDIETADILEDASSNGVMDVDLSQHPCQLPYNVNLRLNQQVRHGSNFIRNVRRIMTGAKYAVTSSPNVGTMQNGTSATASSAKSTSRRSKSGVSGGGVQRRGARTRQTVQNLHMAQQMTQQPQQLGVQIPQLATTQSQQPQWNIAGQPSFGFMPAGMPGPGMPVSFGSSSASLPVSSGPPAFRFSSQHGPWIQNPMPPQAGGTNAVTPSRGSASQSNPSSPGFPFDHPHGLSNMSTSPQPIETATKVLMLYSRSIVPAPDGEDCCICCNSLREAGLGDDESGSYRDPVLALSKCDHMFHESCLTAMYNNGVQMGSLQCPTCKTINGILRGTCPEGKMHTKLIPSELPGFPGSISTIQVSYDIRAGIQGPEHPNPGKPYHLQGFPRSGFLPNNPEGRKVYVLLRKAWLRRLTFTVGTSNTTSRPDCVVWNEIHHKTEMQDRSGHGYPDPKYLDNVTEELAAQGVVLEPEDHAERFIA